MKKTSIFVLILAASWVVGLTACGPALHTPAVSPQLLEQEAALQRELLFKTMIDRQARLQRIYTPLRIANADLCGENISPVTGMTGIDRQTVPADLRGAAQRLYGVVDGVTIVDVVPGSPAAQIGLQARDVITGAAKGAGVMPSGWSWSALTVPDLAKVILTSGGGPITLLVRRSGSVFPIVLTPGTGCSYPIETHFNDSFNAFADGSRIVVYTGLFNHVPDDREISVIIGHELAHNVLKHVEKMQGNAAAGGTAGLLLDIGLLALGVNTQGAIGRAGMQAGAQAYSQEFESEADYLGLYMLARAGFDINVARDLYRRMGVQHPGSQIKNYASIHPSTPERAVAMTQTVLEIEDNRTRREALLPKTLAGQVLAVNTAVQAAPIITASAPVSQPLPKPSAPSAIAQPALGFVSPSQTTQIATSPAPVVPAPASGGRRLFAQLYLIRGPVVSNPPQTFSAEFDENGKASVVLSGRRRLAGNFELFPLSEQIAAKYTARLIKPDAVKPAAGADAKGFAFFTDGTGSELECLYSLTRATGRGQGTCVDNQRNTYGIVFD